MKYLVWKGNSLQIVKSFPKMIREDIGFQLECLQQDQTPTQWQWLPAVGSNVKTILLANDITYYLIYFETQITPQTTGERIQYIYSSDVIYILHAFADDGQTKPQVNFGIAKKILTPLLVN